MLSVVTIGYRLIPKFSHHLNMPARGPQRAHQNDWRFQCNFVEAKSIPRTMVSALLADWRCSVGNYKRSVYGGVEQRRPDGCQIWRRRLPDKPARIHSYNGHCTCNGCWKLMASSTRSTSGRRRNREMAPCARRDHLWCASGTAPTPTRRQLLCRHWWRQRIIYFWRRTVKNISSIYSSYHDWN